LVAIVTISWSCFGTSLERLIRQRSASLRDAIPISVLTAEQRRGAFRLEFCDGTTLKGRRLETVHQAETVWRWSQLQPRSAPVARVLEQRSEALLEEWISGSTLARGVTSSETGHAAGALLGQLHRLAAPARVSRRPVKVRWIDESLASDKLVDAGLLHETEAREADVLARASAPEAAEWGLTHFDFCAENLILEPRRGLVLVDNETVGEHWYDCDLARTWYRWPMNSTAFAAFLEGYRKHRDPAEFVAHFSFWSVCVLLRSAAYRHRIGISAEEPIARLRTLLREPVPSWATR
jgi:thiamine kinase-like enzyme